ncbi:MAG: hypothetical protein LBC85_05845 [Fibromonadaceae bacterium]|jgi:hypothetical protein|nr:hypothetical protein [Fibromonadaceae bacterium]
MKAVLESRRATTKVAYPLLVKDLSGVISENDIKRLSFKDERARYILKGSK